MVKRQRFGRFFVERRKDGTFRKFTSVGRSLAADRRTKSKTIVKSGFGNRGDIQKKGSFFLVTNFRSSPKKTIFKRFKNKGAASRDLKKLKKTNNVFSAKIIPVSQVNKPKSAFNLGGGSFSTNRRKLSNF